ncbi:MAG: metal ABC transporter permease [Planctomycetes bacterium]|nr:metal ABC transporter permease [Planctomycetota bacterium]
MAFTYNTWIVLAGVSLLGACSGLVGSFAVLRRRALIGDALAHAALPGLCLAFLVVGERNLPAMLAGGFLTGLAGVAVIAALRHGTRIKEDAAIGVVLSVFYGAGVVLSVSIQNSVTEGSKAGLESYILGRTAGIVRQDVLLIAGVAAVCLVLVLAMYKEFKLVAFDSGFAGVQGWPAFRLDLLLMAMIALTVIIGLPMVGVVLTAALLIIPAAAARFWTERLEWLLFLSAVFGLAIGAVGTIPSALLRNMPGGPPIVLAGTALFVVSLLFAPRRGLVARSIAARRFRRRIADQTALMTIYELGRGAQGGDDAVTTNAFLSRRAWDERSLRVVMDRLERRGLAERPSTDSVRLTSAGLERGAQLVRSYRLWELFLVEHAETAGNYADLDLDTIDEKLPRELVRELEGRLLEETG